MRHYSFKAFALIIKTIDPTELENTYNKQFKDVYEAINYLLQKNKQETNQKERKQIGYKTK